MPKHTQEPWRVVERLAHEPFPGGFGIYGKASLSAAILSSNLLSEAQQRLDFARASLCVSACVGLSDELLAKGPLREQFKEWLDKKQEP